MKLYVVLKTFKSDFADLFPNVVAIKDSISEAYEIIADECDTTIEKVENEFVENRCYGMANVRYTIYKYI